mgnify:CR=1 FL=1
MSQTFDLIEVVGYGTEGIGKEGINPKKYKLCRNWRNIVVNDKHRYTPYMVTVTMFGVGVCRYSEVVRTHFDWQCHSPVGN